MMGLGFLIQVSHAATTRAYGDFGPELVSQAGFRLAAVAVLLIAYRLGPSGIRRFLPHLIVIALGVYFGSRRGFDRWVPTPSS